MTNSELLRYADLPKTASQVLTNRQQQDLYCLRRALEPMPCPVCGEAVSLVAGSGLTLDDYPVGTGVGKHACPHCKVPLGYVVPFAGACRWEADHAWVKERLARAEAADARA